MNLASVSSEYVSAFLSYLHSTHFVFSEEEVPLLRQVNDAISENTRLSLFDWQFFLGLVSYLHNDPFVGFRFGRTLELTQFDYVGRFDETAVTINSVADAIKHFKPWLTSIGKIDYQALDGKDSAIVWRSDCNRVHPKVVETIVGSWYQLSQQLLLGDCKVIRIHFKHDDHDLRNWPCFLKIPIAFGSQFNGLEMAGNMEQQPLNADNLRTYQQLNNKDKQAINAEWLLLQGIKNMLMNWDFFTCPEPDIIAISAGYTTGELEKYFATRNTSFDALWDDVRLKSAFLDVLEHTLTPSRLKQLGYESDNAFIQHFESHFSKACAQKFLSQTKHVEREARQQLSTVPGTTTL